MSGVFFLAETFGHFLLGHFGHWNIICLTVVSKLPVIMFISLYFQTFWQKLLNYFLSFQKRFGLWPKKIRPQHLREIATMALSLQGSLLPLLTTCNQQNLQDWFICSWTSYSTPDQFSNPDCAISSIPACAN